MKSPIRILHLEDDKNDAELVQLKLSSEGIACDTVLVDTRDGFIFSIEKCSFDLILSDYSLPSFDGVSALEIAKEKCPDTPFIFLSGALGEENAVETLKRGATDYVLKDRLSRLATSINRALREANEIRERKRAVEALSHSEERYRSLFETVKDIIFTLSNDGEITSLNPVFEAITGYSRDEWVGKHFAPIIHPDDLHFSLDLLRRALQGEMLPVFELRLLTKQGEYKLMECTVAQKTIGGEFVIIGIARDVTERKNLEEHLRHAQKMEAIGKFAGGIAHDFNNILMVIKGFASLLEVEMEDGDPLKAYLRRIVSAAERGANLVQALLAFSSGRRIEPEKTDINEIVRKTEGFLLHALKGDVELRLTLSEEILTVMADTTQIERVLLNLATNAADAMPKGGLLTIETSRTEIDREFVKTHGYGNPGTYALINITDTGTGMDEKTKERIFEPFFTTKRIGKGTGLGLSIAYGTIKQHNGYINVFSETGKGTTFKIYLPLVEVNG